MNGARRPDDGTSVPAAPAPVRDALQEAAAAVGATFVDPLDERWLADPEWIAADDISPTDAGRWRAEPARRPRRFSGGRSA